MNKVELNISKIAKKYDNSKEELVEELKTVLENCIIAEDIVSEETGEILVETDALVNSEVIEILINEKVKKYFIGM